ncbi:putative sodium-dependent multivitamin transporter [Chelonus insularis]|uniref:putative sodium-dependent multivitamin transporter n=1 Tax=Chelonus insularis TaxID=460826 RepID=UPI00158C09A3|nr:putative sodium-dependent multivitamin transporter [Chelonus insularis]XP_034947359.1 putative sodium-dependent multivitamin transporter [Chelonus insularis]
MDDNLSSPEAEPTLQWPDWVAVGLTLLASAAIGVYYRFTGGRQKTAEEYFSADQSVGTVMLAFTMMIAYLSAISLLGISGENYSYGAQFNLIYIGLILGTPIVSYFYLPVFYELKMMSVFEYLERRFGKTTRLLASIVNFSQICLYTGIVIYAPSLALESTTGLSGNMSIILIGLICTFYSSIGGIKAIIITDILQGALMFICVYCVIGIALRDIDSGVWGIFINAQEGGRLNFFNFDFDPTVRHTWWSLTIGGTFFFLSLFACNQVQVQRMLTAKTIGDARKALWLNVPMTMMLALTISFSGLVLYSHYQYCDPVTSGKIKSYDMIMPFFAKERLTRIPTLTGIFIAGVFSASLSTVSAMLNSLAAIALADYIKPLYKRFDREFPSDKAAMYGKILGTMIGFASIAIAFLATRLGALIQAVLAVNGAFGGPVLGLFSLGMFTEAANEIGAVIGTVISILLMVWIAFAPKPKEPFLDMKIDQCPNSTFTHPSNSSISDDVSSYLYINRLSYLWFTPLGMSFVIIIGYVVSVIAQKCSKIPQRVLNPNLFTPLVAARIKRRLEKEVKNSQIFVLDSKTFNSKESLES